VGVVCLRARTGAFQYARAARRLAAPDRIITGPHGSRGLTLRIRAAYHVCSPTTHPLMFCHVDFCVLQLLFWYYPTFNLRVFCASMISFKASAPRLRPARLLVCYASLLGGQHEPFSWSRRTGVILWCPATMIRSHFLLVVVFRSVVNLQGHACFGVCFILPLCSFNRTISDFAYALLAESFCPASHSIFAIDGGLSRAPCAIPVLVIPGQDGRIAFDADNPGLLAFTATNPNHMQYCA